MVDNNIIKQCKAGNQRAFSELYNSCVPYVFSIVKRYIYNESIWKDQVQESFVQIFKGLNNYNPKKGAFKPYLRMITVNTCLMHLRKNKSLPILTAVDEIYEEPTLDKGHEKILNLDRKEIENLLSDMPSGYKTIFLLHVIDDFSYKEIGEMLGIAQDTVRSQYFRAKKWIMNKSLIDHKNKSYGLF